MSLESIASVKEKVSCGWPVIASGLLASGPACRALVVAGVQPCVMVSGLYWKMMTFGIGSGKRLGELDQPALEVEAGHHDEPFA